MCITLGKGNTVPMNAPSNLLEHTTLSWIVIVLLVLLKEMHACRVSLLDNLLGLL